MSHPTTIRDNLTLAYHILAAAKLDDHTYTHLTSRAQHEDAFYIYPFGLLFEEVTADQLLKVSFNGEILQGKELNYNRTGYTIHSAIYKARPDINHVFHLHTTATIAASIDQRGLRPLSQFALHFYNRLAYHDYQSLVLDPLVQASTLTQDLGQHKTMLLRNHGSITCGNTIHEALFYTHHLEQACRVQVALNGLDDQYLIEPSAATCEKTCRDLLGFEKNLGLRDWQAWVRRIERKQQARSSAPLRGDHIEQKEIEVE